MFLVWVVAGVCVCVFIQCKCAFFFPTLPDLVAWNPKSQLHQGILMHPVRGSDGEVYMSSAAINSRIYTGTRWWPLFWLEFRPCFRWLIFKNRGHLGAKGRCRLYRHEITCIYNIYIRNFGGIYGKFMDKWRSMPVKISIQGEAP